VIRWLLRLAVLAGLGFVAWKVWQLLQEDEDHSHEWVAAAPPVVTEKPEAKHAAAKQVTATHVPEKHVPEMQVAEERVAAKPWVKPVGSTCPSGYPVKAKMASKVFRVPGMFSYEESKPERCYCDEGAAIADGFTRAKR
jgi:hypothetical protein